MTNCNCECLCLEYQDECLECCFCDFDIDNSQEDVPDVPYVPSQQEIEQELAESRQAIEFFQNKINMLDRQDSDYEWKLNYYHGKLILHRQNIFELYIALENAV
jgi:hypothetical protein